MIILCLSIRLVSDKAIVMKKILIVLGFLFLMGCVHRNPLSEMRFQTVMAPPYVISTWYKISEVGEPVKFYIEGVGHKNYPNPDSELVRNLAQGDKTPNVVYIALPCQYGVSVGCSENRPLAVDNTLIDSMNQVVKTMMKKARSDKMILVGYDMGAEVATELTAQYPTQVNHLVSIGGVWAQEPKKNFAHVAQTHYRGEKDTVASIEKTPDIFPQNTIMPVRRGSHTDGYWSIRKDIWNIR